ncbi:MAG: hypothetical protein ACLS6H_03470, partial [Clostridium sp.]
MFRMWGKIMKDNHLVKDMVACCGDYSISRTQMVFNCLDEICYKFDLEKPMWLDGTHGSTKKKGWKIHVSDVG